MALLSVYASPLNDESELAFTRLRGFFWRSFPRLVGTPEDLHLPIRFPSFHSAAWHSIIIRTDRLRQALMPLRVPVTVAVTPLAAAIWTRVAARWL